MKLAFFGLANCFDFEHIGGTNSIVRRLAQGLGDLGDDIGYVHYGCERQDSYRINDQIEIQRCRTLADALDILKASYDQVVTIYLLPLDRIKYARFRKSQNNRMIFHHLYQGWSELRLKRELLFAEARVFPYNGALFCISPRIRHYVSKWATRSLLLLPPVPEDYFLMPFEKSNGEKIIITYAGRVDPGKGTWDAVRVFRRLAPQKHIDMRVCGFPWAHKPDTVQLHEELIAEPDIQYEPVEYKSWTPTAEDKLRSLLRETDILFLPYRKLSSTIDTPLLLLEGMASLCAVITPPFGNIPEIYGPSLFMLSKRWKLEALTDTIEKARQLLPDERERIFRRNRSIRFDMLTITDIFRAALYGSS